MIVKYKLKQPVIISKHARKVFPSGTIVIKINKDLGKWVVENVNTGKRFATTEDNLTEI